ncbi:hypothetical protein P7C71_g1250, partial [Lecanoromycetidae sp. Uapishka_2]
MVKAEADRDYYADLELKPSADANEIKRAFKKLALKYHPDRNPGHEVEFNSKFQAIQSANEVLTDPQQRAKYDAQRIRAGLLHTYNNTASPPPTKPNVPPRAGAPPASPYPPPPPAPPYTAKTHVPPRPSGAQKYAQFTKADTTASWRDRDDPKEEKSKYKAWEQMKHGTGPIPQPQKRPVPPRVPRSTTFAGREPREPPNGAMPMPQGATYRRDQWDRFKESSTGSSADTKSNTNRVYPKRNVFAPGTPGGEERQARSAYAYMSRDDPLATSRSHNTMPPPPRSPVPTAKKPEPMQGFKDKQGHEPFGNRSRLSTPYQTGGRGKEYFASPGLQRSATSATPGESKDRTGFYETKPTNLSANHARAASATSNYKDKSPPRNEKTNLPHVYMTSSSSSSSDEDEQPPTSSNSHPTQSPKNKRAPAGPRQHSFNPNVKGSGADEWEPQASFRDAYYTGPRRHSAIDIDTQNSSGHSEPHAPHEAQKAAQPNGNHHKSGSQASEDSQPPLARSKSWQEKYGSPPMDKQFRSAPGGQDNKASIFNIPNYTNRTFADHTPLRSQSHESIDTRFSPDGSRPAFFSPPPIRTSTPLRNVSPTEDGLQTGLHADSTEQHMRNKSSTRTVPPPPPPAQSKFAEAQWASHFDGVKFDMENPPTGRSGSRTSNRKRVRTWPKPANPQPTVNNAEDEPTAGSTTGSTTGESVESSAANSDIDPMDLDEPTPPNVKNGERKANTFPTPSTQANGTASTPRQGPTLPPRENGHKQPDAGTAKFNLGDWQHQYPFASSNEGLANMNDMTTTLPFESRASPTKPATETSASRNGLPHPPRCPNAPPNLTQSSCEHYLAKLRQYMDAWNGFHTEMVGILAAKQAFNQDCSKCNWLDIRGNGYDDYMKGLEEHKRARVHLDTAYEHHEKDMASVGLLRSEIIRGRGGAGRKPSDVEDMLQNLL